MSYTNHELDTILNISADFDLALSEKKWSECEAMIEQMGDLGYENEARILHQTLNRAKAHDANEKEDLAAGNEDPRDANDERGL